MVDDVVIHEVLHEAGSSCSIRSFLMAHEPVYKFLCHEAVWIGAQVVAPVLDQFPVMKPQPSNLIQMSQNAKKVFAAIHVVFKVHHGVKIDGYHTVWICLSTEHFISVTLKITFQWL